VNEQVQIRQGSLDDQHDVARLYVQLKEHHRELQPANPRYTVDEERWADIARTALEDPEVFVYVAEIGDRVVGFMKITYAQKPWGVSCELETMVVDGPERGRGIGARLLEKAESDARDRGAKGMRVDVLIPNYEGRSFYEQAGYEMFAVRYGKRIGD
jgi:GNAT superfamily N-acetyltransferase